jgi:hypothetical protein
VNWAAGSELDETHLGVLAGRCRARCSRRFMERDPLMAAGLYAWNEYLYLLAERAAPDKCISPLVADRVGSVSWWKVWRTSGSCGSFGALMTEDPTYSLGSRGISKIYGPRLQQPGLSRAKRIPSEAYFDKPISTNCWAKPCSRWPGGLVAGSRARGAHDTGYRTGRNDTHFPY